MYRFRTLLSLLFFAWRAAGQSCENYGISNGTSCTCPSGFGGSTCSEPGCGGNIFQGSSRNLASGSINLTSSSCSCESGWGGFGCNVCQSSSACQTGFTDAGGSSGSLTNGLPGSNTTLVCNNQAKVAAAGQMSCNVIVRPPHATLPHNAISYTFPLESNFTSHLPWPIKPQYSTNPSACTHTIAECHWFWFGWFRVCSTLV